MAIVFDTKAELEEFLEAFELRDISHAYPAISVRHQSLTESEIPETKVQQPESDLPELNDPAYQDSESVFSFRHEMETSSPEEMDELPAFFANAS